MKKKLRAWVFIGMLNAIVIGACIYDAAQQPAEDVWIQSTENILRFDIAAEEITVEQSTLQSIGEYRLTAYCSCKKCCKKWAENRPLDEFGNEIVYGASGAVLEVGKSIAVDPDVIPYGTTVIINGHEYIAHDCGGPIKGNCIDIYFASHDAALEFGVQYAEVFIVAVQDD